MFKIAVLPGDGIGPEVMQEALRVLDVAQERFDFQLTCTSADVGGIAIDRHAQALPAETLRLCEASDAVLFGSADGCVYCLRASDGAIVWRFRAAPRDACTAGSSSTIRVVMIAVTATISIIVYP